jgi:hypothetical protein
MVVEAPMAEAGPKPAISSPQVSADAKRALARSLLAVQGELTGSRALEDGWKPNKGEPLPKERGLAEPGG